MKIPITCDIAYGYDGLDRLVSEVESSGVSRTYTYDLAGNRLAKTETGFGVIAYALGIGDRLATYTGGSYSYDTAGCVTAIDRTGKPDLDLTWNGQYQLTSVSTNGVVAESYTYDPLGRRFSTTSGGTTLRHVYNGIHCVADIDSVGRVVKSYTWGPGIDNLLAVTCHSGTLATTYYALTDLQGTVHGFTDADGNLVARYAYDAWGNLLDVDVAVSALADNRFLFQGREYSWATGLYSFRLRGYDPATGRWLSKDPIGISGGLNLYAFCGNDPVNYVDPWGMDEDGVASSPADKVAIAALNDIYPLSETEEWNGLIYEKNGNFYRGEPVSVPLNHKVKIPIPTGNITIIGDYHSHQHKKPWYQSNYIPNTFSEVDKKGFTPGKTRWLIGAGGTILRLRDRTAKDNEQSFYKGGIWAIDTYRDGKWVPNN